MAISARSTIFDSDAPEARSLEYPLQKLWLAHPGEGCAGQSVESASTAWRLVRLQAEEALSSAAVAPVAGDLRPCAMRAFVDGRRPPGDQRLRDALGQQARGVCLKIEQLLDRGLRGDFLLELLEFVHARSSFRAGA
jgi:hypothetical protein